MLSGRSTNLNRLYATWCGQGTSRVNWLCGSYMQCTRRHIVVAERRASLRVCAHHSPAVSILFCKPSSFVPLPPRPLIGRQVGGHITADHDRRYYESSELRISIHSILYQWYFCTRGNLSFRTIVIYSESCCWGGVYIDTKEGLY